MLNMEMLDTPIIIAGMTISPFYLHLQSLKLLTY